MKWIRFPNLVEKGVVNAGGRMTLKRLIDNEGFPPGVLITPNARAWDEDLVDAWIAGRPSARKAAATNQPQRGPGRPRKDAGAAVAARP
jgi:predicted DNA-binding transcriptional regulator AlpA